MDRYDETIRRISAEELGLDRDNLQDTTKLDVSSSAFRRFWDRSVAELCTDKKALLKTFPGYSAARRTEQTERALAVMASVLPDATTALSYGKHGGEVPTIESLAATFRHNRFVPSGRTRSCRFRPWSRRKLVLVYTIVPLTLPVGLTAIALVARHDCNSVCPEVQIWPMMIASTMFAAGVSILGLWLSYRLAKKAIRETEPGSDDA